MAFNLQSKTLKMGIIGHGFVGKAVDFGFKNTYEDEYGVEKYLVDPRYKTSVDTMFAEMTPDIIFVSVPTPMGENGFIDSSIIMKVFEDIKKYSNDILVVVKSTVTPNKLEEIYNFYNRIIYNPEFLRERSANDDFINSPMLVIGGENPSDQIFVKYVYDKFSKCEPCPVHFVDLKAAALIKYTINSFLATKVLYFNNIKKIFDASGTTTHWNGFLDAIKDDERIGDSHMSVPGPDGRLGFGGACFPKDTTALAMYARHIGESFDLLEDAIKENQDIRSRYEDLDDREKEQNVNFNIL